MTLRGVYVQGASRGRGRGARARNGGRPCPLPETRRRADLALFHEFAPPPTGGGHQFLRALVAELERRGLVVELNRISAGTTTCLFNSFNFDFRRLRRFARDDVRFVHRVDGPIGTYRGFDDGTDARIAEINRRARRRDDRPVALQPGRAPRSRDRPRRSAAHRRTPSIPALFHPPAAREPLAGRRVRVIATSWSDNPNKGADVLAWLDEHLDHERYELTFAGRTDESFERIRALGPIPLEPLAAELRRNDVYLAPSRNDPCSNALLEALASGLARRVSRERWPPRARR